MANSYDYEFNNTFPIQTIGAEFSPYEDFGKNGKKSYGLKKLLLALTTAGAATLIALSPLNFGVKEVDSDSALLVYEYQVQNDAAGDTVLRYRLYAGQDFVEEGEMEPGTDTVLLDELKSDTLYILRIWNGEKHIKTIRFRTNPLQPIDLGFRGDPGDGGEQEEPAVLESLEPSPTASPKPSPTPSPTPVPSPTPTPSPEPTPSPTPYEPPYVPPAPIPATPEPEVTAPPYYDPDPSTTTDPSYVIRGLNLEVDGGPGDYTIVIYPNINNVDFNVTRLKMTVRGPSGTYNSPVYEGDYLTGPFMVNTDAAPGEYTLEVQVEFKDESGQKKRIVINEPFSIIAEPPVISINEPSYSADKTEVFFSASIDSGDYIIKNVTAWYDDGTGEWPLDSFSVDIDNISCNGSFKYNTERRKWGVIVVKVIYTDSLDYVTAQIPYSFP